MKSCHCRKVDGTGDDHVEWDKPSSERQIFYVSAHLQNKDLKTKNMKEDWWGGPAGEQMDKESVMGQWIWPKYIIYAYENSIMKCTKNCLESGGGIRKSNRGGKFDQSTLYTYI
jgi:hypothetical protein